MPQRNGTGPDGQGPGSGRERGPCGRGRRHERRNRARNQEPVLGKGSRLDDRSSQLSGLLIDGLVKSVVHVLGAALDRKRNQNNQKSLPDKNSNPTLLESRDSENR